MDYVLLAVLALIVLWALTRPRTPEARLHAKRRREIRRLRAARRRDERIHRRKLRRLEADGIRVTWR